MDAHGDTAVMHNDLPHSFYPSAFHCKPTSHLPPRAPSDVEANIAQPAVSLLPTLDSTTFFQPIGTRNVLSSHTATVMASWSQSRNAGSRLRLSSTVSSSRTGEQTSKSSDQPTNNPLRTTTRIFGYHGARRATETKASPDSISSNEYKKGKFGQDYATLTNDSSPQSSTCSPPPVLSTRAHYAVEKRYRSTLNERYATLARIVTQTETMEICRTEVPDWEVPMKLEVPEEGAEKHPGKRQSKTTTLSVAIEAIELLDRACVRKAREYQELSQRLSAIAGSVSMNSECKEQ